MDDHQQVYMTRLLDTFLVYDMLHGEWQAFDRIIGRGRTQRSWHGMAIFETDADESDVASTVTSQVPRDDAPFKAYLFGGSTLSRRYTDLVSAKWDMDGGEIVTEGIESVEEPAARSSHTLTRVHSRLYLLGGGTEYQQHQMDMFRNDLWYVDVSSSGDLLWHQVDYTCQDVSFAARWGHSTTWLDKYLVVFGGQMTNDKWSNEVFLFQVLGVPDRRIAGVRFNSQCTCRRIVPDGPEVPVGRHGHTANAISPTEIVIFGGWASGRSSGGLDDHLYTKNRHGIKLADCWVLRFSNDFSSAKWINIDIGRITRCADRVLKPVCGHVAGYFDGRLFVFGGRVDAMAEEEEQNELFSDKMTVIRLRPSSLQTLCMQVLASIKRH